MKIAKRTEHRIPKKAKELTIQVVPKSRLKLVMLRVLSSRNATPSTKKCGLNLRMVVPVKRAARAIAISAPMSTSASATR